jgi:adenosylmethionine-8-amino-7-oxononanoate aminotransferase
MEGNKSQNVTDEILGFDEHLVHSFADLNTLKRSHERTVIAEAHGAYVYDSDGNRFLDGIGGLWCVNVGHGRREIIDAIADQLQRLDYYSTFYNLTHPQAARLSEKIASLAPETLNHVYFGNSGSVANDSAIRILHHYFNRIGKPKKKKILSRIGAYHGSTHLAIAMTTPAYRQDWDSAEELVHFLASPYPYRRPDGMTVPQFLDSLIDEMVEAIEKIGPEYIAAFIAEPILGAGGVIVPPEGYHRRTRQVCERYEIKYVSDEVVTAFGRLGRMFASEDVFGIVPDIITTAKGLTSGYQPLSATILSDEIFEVISEPGGRFLHGMTYSGHPAACAAALANIALMEKEDLCGHVRSHGVRFAEALKSLEELPIVGEVRGSHFMQGIEFVSNKTSKTAFDDDANIGGMIAQSAQERGLIVRPLGSMAILSPPLILGNDEIDFVVSVLRDSIIATVEDLKSEGML